MICVCTNDRGITFDKYYEASLTFHSSFLRSVIDRADPSFVPKLGNTNIAQEIHRLGRHSSVTWEVFDFPEKKHYGGVPVQC